MDCGLLRSSPRMTLESAQKFYESEYRTLYSGHVSREYLFENQVARGRQIVREMRSLASQVESIFEVGCCSGGMLLPFQEIGKTVAGCDLDEDYLAFGRRKGLNLLHGTAKSLRAQKENSADLVILSHVVEHFVHPQEELQDAVRLLREGGYLFIEVPGLLSMELQYKDNLLLYLQNAHNYHFTAQTLSNLLGSVGLNIISVDETIVLAAQRPEGWKPESRAVETQPGHAQRVLDFLTRVERKVPLKNPGIPGENHAQSETATMDPWPLGTGAKLRVVAWPNYNDPESIGRVLMVSEPLFNNSDACLCLRYDKELDIPMDEAKKNLNAAFEKFSDRGELNILMIDDAMEKSDWPRLGKSATCVLQTDEEIDPTRREFIDALGIEIISGRQ